MLHYAHQPTNIPTDLIRTLVTVADVGSFTKAATKLGMSQPAVSAQIKKLQFMIGGPIFDQTANGSSLNALGHAVLDHGRKFLQLNDQMLSLVGGLSTKQTIRVGIGYLYIEDYLAACAAHGPIENVSVQAGHSDDLKKLFTEGYLDVVCLVEPEPSADSVCEWSEELVWVRSRQFVLSPGQPLPLVGRAGAMPEATVMKALKRSGLAYEMVFVCSDLQTRIAAVAEGLGVMCLPQRYVREPLMVAREYYLPRIDPIRSAILVKEDVGAGARMDDLLKRLRLNKPLSPAA